MAETMPPPTDKQDARRPHLTADEYMDIARLIIEGQPQPFYGLDMGEILSDIRLAHMNEISKLVRQAEYFERTGAACIAATGRVWRLVFATDKRLTMRTADVRAALEGEQA